MNKDVIYIDTEDDITAIIGKIKDSKEKIVALVPPKRIGVLQSAVNLRLLAKMAEQNSKRLVLVTSNKALVNLSSVANIPVAKSLQSKPEMMEIEELINDDAEDVIEGEKLSVGELMKTADEPMDIKITPERRESVNDIIDEINIDKDVSGKDGDIDGETIEMPVKKIKVPDFVKFRTFLFLGIFGLICLAGFLYWATVYAPAAEVIVSAKTRNESVSKKVILSTETNLETSTIKITPHELSRDLTVTFDATGQKNTGNRATGIVTVENCDSSTSFTIASGTTFTASSGETYVNDSDVVVPGFTGSAYNCRRFGTGAGTVDAAVTATAAGEEYNITASDFEISGVTGDIYPRGGDMTGGTTKMSTVVTKEDIEKATIALKALSTDSAKQQLLKEFTEEESVINESYSITYGEFVSTPAVDQEATGKATLKSTTIFKASSIAKADIEAYLNDEFTKKINVASEKIYDNGIGDVGLSRYVSNADGVTITITASGKVGPNLSEDIIVEAIKGKRFGDAQSIILDMPGVSDVEINFSYFWVQTMPSDTQKIDIQFILDDAQNS